MGQTLQFGAWCGSGPGTVLWGHLGSSGLLWTPWGWRMCYCKKDLPSHRVLMAEPTYTGSLPPPTRTLMWFKALLVSGLSLLRSSTPPYPMPALLPFLPLVSACPSGPLPGEDGPPSLPGDTLPLWPVFVSCPSPWLA